jgi:hypothetical protein
MDAVIVARTAALAICACGGPEWSMPEHRETRDDHRGLAIDDTGQGVPVLVSALPIRASRATDDRDRDGLSDAWEDAVLAAVRPILLLHTDDGAFHDPEAVLALVGRVAPAGDHVLVAITIAFARDYGRCGGDRHAGDTERVAIELIADPRRPEHAVIANRWYTAAHEGTASDRGATGTFSELGPPPPESGIDPATEVPPLWSVFVARDKHASYTSQHACAGNRAPCLDDVCADFATVVPLDLAPWNAGEPDAPRLDALDEVGFPGECAWCSRNFCGGRTATGCASPMTDKLLVDPFVL